MKKKRISCQTISLNSKGQFAMEYLMVIGLMLVLGLGIGSYIYLTQQPIENHRDSAMVDHIVNDIARKAREVYYQGEPARRVVEASFPRGITGASFDDRTVTFEFQIYGTSNPSEIHARAGVPLSGSISYGEGNRIILIEAREGYVEISNYD